MHKDLMDFFKAPTARTFDQTSISERNAKGILETTNMGHCTLHLG